MAYNYNDYDGDGIANTPGNPELDVNTDDGSCIAVVLGCIEEDACNYNAGANTPDDFFYPCVYSTDLHYLRLVHYETDGTGTIVDNDIDGDVPVMLMR